jgi:hypothetical protein
VKWSAPCETGTRCTRRGDSRSTLHLVVSSPSPEARPAPPFHRPTCRRTVVGMSTPAPTRTGWAAPRGPFPPPPAPPRPDGLAAVYRRRDPTAAPLYPRVQHHLETFLADAASADPVAPVYLSGSRTTSVPTSTAASSPTVSPASAATHAPPSDWWPLSGCSGSWTRSRRRTPQGYVEAPQALSPAGLLFQRAVEHPPPPGRGSRSVARRERARRPGWLGSVVAVPPASPGTVRRIRPAMGMSPRSSRRCSRQDWHWPGWVVGLSAAGRPDCRSAPECAARRRFGPLIGRLVASTRPHAEIEAAAHGPCGAHAQRPQADPRAAVVR